MEDHCFAFTNQNMVRFEILPIAFREPFVLRYQSLSGLLIFRSHNIRIQTVQAPIPVHLLIADMFGGLRVGFTGQQV